MGNRPILYIGIACIAAAVLNSTLSLLRFKPLNIWSILFAVGCVLISIGLGQTGFKPWNKIAKSAKQIQKNRNRFKL
jgi:hypothetical protein